MSQSLFSGQRDQRAFFNKFLEQLAPQFLQYKHDTNYKGDGYPPDIAKLDALLSAYKPPEDAVGTALSALKEKYSLSDSEI